MKLSVVLATFNEEKNIRQCLSSVKIIADEIIVVDGLSEDQTPKIAKKIGALVYSLPNQKQFHKNKQIAIDKAKNDWVLQLDADERVTPELRKEIASVLKTNPNYSAFAIPRLNFFLGRFLKKGGVYPDPVIRLFKKDKAKFSDKEILNNGITTSNVHAQLEVEGEVGNLKNNLLHYGDRTFAQYMKRFNRYTSLEAENLIKLKFNPNFFNALNFILLKPIYWFLLRFLRHKGFVDGFQGFVFALMSSLHYPIIFLKVKEKEIKAK